MKYRCDVSACRLAGIGLAAALAASPAGAYEDFRERFSYQCMPWMLQAEAGDPAIFDGATATIQGRGYLATRDSDYLADDLNGFVAEAVLHLPGTDSWADLGIGRTGMYWFVCRINNDATRSLDLYDALGDERSLDQAGQATDQTKFRLRLTWSAPASENRWHFKCDLEEWREAEGDFQVRSTVSTTVAGAANRNQEEFDTTSSIQVGGGSGLAIDELEVSGTGVGEE